MTEIPLDADSLALNKASEASALFKEVSASSAPVIEEPEDDIVHLPGGATLTGKKVRVAKVRELTGADEEEIARAYNSSPVRVLSTILVRGTESLDDIPATREDIDSLLVGDRDAILLGIRKATFGADVEIPEVRCNSCGEMVDISLTLDDIPVKRLESPDDAEFQVPLRKGGHAVVRLVTGMDQAAVFEDPNLTNAERNTLLLSRVVQAIEDRNKDLHPVLGRVEYVRDRLGMADRQRILREIEERQPGPLINEVKVQHDVCGNDIIVPLGMMDLFQSM